MTLKDYAHILPLARLNPRYEHEFADIFNDSNSIFTDCPAYVKELMFEFQKTMYAEYTVDCPNLDTDYFSNLNLNQIVFFSLYHDNMQIWFYKRLVENNKFIRFPLYLTAHQKTNFSSETILPIDIQNALILK